MKLNDLLAHYGRVMPVGAMLDVDRAIRLSGAHHPGDGVTRLLGRGDPAPDVRFLVATASDNAVATSAAVPSRLAALLVAGPVVLKFYRGRWCPYCTLELRAWQRHLDRLARLGARFVAVSPQNRDETESTRLRDSLTMPLVSDPGNAIAAQFGLAYQLVVEERRLLRAQGIDLSAVNARDESGESGWSLPIPALYVIGRDGRIAFRFADPDYRNRAEPEAVMAAVGALGRPGPHLNRRARAPGSCG